MVVLVVVAVVAVVVFVFFFSWDPPAAVPSLRFVPESRSTNNMDGSAFGDSVRRLVVTTPMVVVGGVFVGDVSMGTTSTSFPGCPWSR